MSPGPDGPIEANLQGGVHHTQPPPRGRLQGGHQWHFGIWDLCEKCFETALNIEHFEFMFFSALSFWRTYDHDAGVKKNKLIFFAQASATTRFGPLSWSGSMILHLQAFPRILEFFAAIHCWAFRPFQTKPNHTELMGVDQISQFVNFYQISQCWPNFTMLKKNHNFTYLPTRQLG